MIGYNTHSKMTLSEEGYTNNFKDSRLAYHLYAYDISENKCDECETIVDTRGYSTMLQESPYVGLNFEIGKIEKQFNELAKKWKTETAGYSTAFHKFTNKNYLGILGMGIAGMPVVPLILKDLQNGPEFWHFALKNITNENPVPKKNINNLLKIREAWLEWGKINKLI